MSNQRSQRSPSDIIKQQFLTWYPVRCCCTPRKIFGFIRLPSDKPSVIVHDFFGKEHMLEVKLIRTGHVVLSHEEDTVVTEHNEELAVYSDDRPIEFWRTIPGFMELGMDDPK